MRGQDFRERGLIRIDLVEPIGIPYQVMVTTTAGDIESSSSTLPLK